MPHQFGEHFMQQGKDRSMFSIMVVDAMKQLGTIRKGRMHHAVELPMEDEEAGLAALDPQIGSANLVHPRKHVVGCFRALVRDAFHRHALSEEGGLDIGSGASGYMVEKLLPPNAKSNWLQMELSPAAAKMNADAHPGSRVLVGSYLRLSEQGVKEMFDVVTGLSSLDATAYIDHAVEQVRMALKKGGYLLHVQDTRPGVLLVHQELRHRGAPSPYDRIYIDDEKAKPNNTLLYRHGMQAFDVIELFRRRLGRAISDNKGFELVENSWMTAVGAGTTPGMNKYSELGLMAGLEATGPESIDAASAVITVAKRIR